MAENNKKQRHNFRKLEVWKEAIALTTDIFLITKSFPNDERFGLISQMTRSAASVPSNIAEGTSRKSDKHFVTFLETALGSAFELETQLIVSNNVDYMANDAFEKLLAKNQHIQNMIFNLIEKLENN